VLNEKYISVQKTTTDTYHEMDGKCYKDYFAEQIFANFLQNTVWVP